MPKKSVIIENAEILPGRFRNFSGKPGTYNAEGDRNFCLVIPPEVAGDMEADGWNIKVLNKRSDEEDDRYYIKVKVRFGSNKPPKIVMITSGGKTMLDEESVDMLDWADIETADVAINPYESEVRGQHYVTAYLKSLYVTIEEDDLDRKYADVGPMNEVTEEEDLPF